ncbi:MAG: O-antigen ligase family protein [Xanthomonadales bacterium]|nr:O-antigen ligase family protein [Xanthomonadales bacterium]
MNAAHASGGGPVGGAPLPFPALAPVLLLWSVLALLPVGRLSEVPLLVAAGWGLVLLWREGWDLLRLPGVRLALLAFAGYWLPALVSAFDAVDPGRTWGQVAAQLRFAPFALFVAATLRTAAQWRWLLAASALLVAAWVLDAWLQALTGVSLGGAMTSDRLSGVFGAGNLKLGGVLAALSPLLLAWTQRRFGLPGVFAVGLLLAGVILLAGARAAWLVYLLVLAGWCVRPFAGGSGRAIAVAGLLVVAGAGIGLAAYQLSPSFAERFDRTLHLGRGSAGDLDHALAGRLPIWRTAAAMAQAHPVNGVGVRGFRHAYADHARPDDPWLAQGVALHPHQLLLELASETGLFGLVCWALTGLLLLAAGRRAPPEARERGWPVALALLAMTFPLNTHYAFYSSWWGLFFWWLLAVAIAVLHLRPEPPR